uniref:Putative alpha toxin Tx417 n=1 Tax=Buthus israelis TaxID=2899555 RepID=B8XGZ4_BUTIS|nr:putative alpha toxin Tx417 [Buthus occitanus israelis]
MYYLMIISLAHLLMTGVESNRSGYIAQQGNCVYHCMRNDYCHGLCIKNGASSGYCHWLGIYGNACWCYALPDKIPIKVPQGHCNRR